MRKKGLSFLWEFIVNSVNVTSIERLVVELVLAVS